LKWFITGSYMECRPEDILGVPADVDTLDEQLDDASLHGGEELVPQRIAPLQGIADVGFVSRHSIVAARAVCVRLLGTQKAAQLIHDVLDRSLVWLHRAWDPVVLQ
jgi:hypothetical protein